MKRSRKILLVLSGTLASGTLVGCGPAYDSARLAEISESGMYTNNYYVPGVGYYHAPYHAWFPYPHNYYDPSRGYYHGGIWTSTPERDAVTASHPSGSAVHSAHARAHSVRSGAVARGGFGGTAHHVGS